MLSFYTHSAEFQPPFVLIKWQSVSVAALSSCQVIAQFPLVLGLSGARMGRYKKRLTIQRHIWGDVKYGPDPPLASCVYTMYIHRIQCGYSWFYTHVGFLHCSRWDIFHCITENAWENKWTLFQYLVAVNPGSKNGRLEALHLCSEIHYRVGAIGLTVQSAKWFQTDKELSKKADQELKIIVMLLGSLYILIPSTGS